MVSTLFRDPQALSSTLTSLRMLQPQTFRSLNHVETLNSASNYYTEKHTYNCKCTHTYIYIDIIIVHLSPSFVCGHSQR